MSDVIEVVVVDDHPAVCAGLAELLDAEPGLACVATARTAADGAVAVQERRPAVVVVDYDLSDGDGLTFGADLKASLSAPGVVLYSAFVSPRLLPAAAVAGIDAMLDKAAPSEELFAAVRGAARGYAALPAAPPEVRERCLARLDPADVALFAMAVNGTHPADIAAVMRLESDEARRRLRALLGRLQERRPDASVVGG
jgi:DNA-binding NarL/FixJ family response regulator